MAVRLRGFRMFIESVNYRIDKRGNFQWSNNQSFRWTDFQPGKEVPLWSFNGVYTLLIDLEDDLHRMNNCYIRNLEAYKDETI